LHGQRTAYVRVSSFDQNSERHLEPVEIIKIHERQREGIALAKQRGAYRGRKKSLSPDQEAELRQRVAAGEKKAGLARELGISRETLIVRTRLGEKYRAAPSRADRLKQARGEERAGSRHVPEPAWGNP
jgi:DNA invertase Pin-like site-specific DNA recombinase